MSSFSLHIDPSVFSRLAEGDEQSFREIFHHFYPRLEAYVLKMVHDEQLTQEIVQDVLLMVWMKQREFAGISHPVSWIFKVATNKAYDHLKKLSREGRLLQLLAGQTPFADLDTENQVQWKESTALLHAAVQRLPEQQKEVYRLNKEEGLSTAKIAERLSLSQSTVKNHLVRAMRSIRQFMTQAGRILSL